MVTDKSMILQTGWKMERATTTYANVSCIWREFDTGHCVQVKYMLWTWK